jgi:nucleoside-diphosphate-sugar epimerase
VHTYLIMSPTIYGLGSGRFNRSSIQLPILIRSALKTGRVSVLGPGSGAWDAVHIDDLVLLYELLLAKVLNGDQDVPSGKKGIFFSETGDYTWLQLAEGLAKAMKKQGLIETDEPKHLALKEAADLWAGGNESYVELGFASK